MLLAELGAAQTGLCVLETLWETSVPLGAFCAIDSSKESEGRRRRARAPCDRTRAAWQSALLRARFAHVGRPAYRA